MFQCNYSPLIWIGNIGPVVRPAITKPPVVYTCENITQIEFCSQVGYSTASFPNYRDQFTQTSASSELENFRALAKSVCSNAVVHFLCSVYAPFCDPLRPDIQVPPCRELCEHVRQGCEPPVIQFGLSWPPHLECNLYPVRNSSLITFCPSNISVLSIPSNIQTNPPPTQPATTTIVTSTDMTTTNMTTTDATTTDVTTTDITVMALATTISSRSLPLSLSVFLYSVSLYLTLFFPWILASSYTHA